MDFIPNDRILEFKPDTMEFIRKQYDLDQPGQMKEAGNILREWVQKLSHFKKKDFCDHYYEVAIVACKWSWNVLQRNEVPTRQNLHDENIIASVFHKL